jgi:response regulator RpfG family c-di-GMP phosphodiesterase
MINHDNAPIESLFVDDIDVSDTMALSTQPWKVMIVDDEPAMHDVTTLALKGVKFQDRDLQFLHCYSGAEAKKAILEHPDTAVMLLDVVMESEHAGLDVASFVRSEADNKKVRIVLRTGQPGQAPERKVISDYDINDYKEKTELTSNKLFTLMYSCLRAYSDIDTIERSKLGLIHVVESSADIFKLSSIDRFAAGVLEQLAALLGADRGLLYLSNDRKRDGLAIQLRDGIWQVIVGTGAYCSATGKPVDSILSPYKLEIIKKAQTEKRNIIQDDMFVGYFEAHGDHCNLLFIDGVSHMDMLEHYLVDIFTRNVSIAFDNVYLHEDIEATQSEIVYMLGEAVEKRSRETGNHVKRVAEISRLLALEVGLSEAEAETLAIASPLHDLGKIAIPDGILNKPGRHTPEEQEIMRTHAEIGYLMLKNSKRRILQAAAIVAHEHHERWDGAGYPQGLAGSDIHIYGRITAVADVFDALGSSRCYKTPWALEDIKALFERERGKQFDPQLVDILFEKIDDIAAIRERLPDQE